VLLERGLLSAAQHLEFQRQAEAGPTAAGQTPGPAGPEGALPATEAGGTGSVDHLMPPFPLPVPDLDPARPAHALPTEGTPVSGRLPVQQPTGNDLPGGTSPAVRGIGPPLRIGSAFEEETRVLLRRRLLHVHLVFGVNLLALIIYCLAGAGEAMAYGANPTLGAALQSVVLLYIAVTAVYLWRNPGVRLKTLRRLELISFTGGMLMLGVLRVNSFLDYSPESPDPRWAKVAAERIGVMSIVPFFFALTFYGVYIPNTRRRSLLVVASMATIPLFAIGLAAVFNPAIRQFLPYIVSMNLLGVGLVSVLAVFSAARISTLQRQAYEARREAQQVGPYTLKRLLGKGGMGEVYLAEHRLLKRPCAVKLIRPELSSDPRSVARFVREVQAVTGLTHLHTVRVYDYGQTEDGAFYYVMEYLDGQSLEALVKSEGPLAPGRVVHLLRQVCGALAEAHAAGLVHRDVKPGNIFIATLGGERDMAKLLDFGLVQDLGAISTDEGRLTRTGTIMGTPAYMSPEQAGGEPTVDGRVDIYGVGAVAFFALTGRPPFDAPSVGKLLSAHLTQRPPRADAVRDGVPADLADVIARCLAKAATDRYQTAAELDGALAGCACAVARSSSHPVGESKPPPGWGLPPGTASGAETAFPAKRGQPSAQVAQRRPGDKHPS
jgi:serine/threonine-protein kinase